jgi:hypothetical protein
MIAVIVILALALIGLSAVYLTKNKNLKPERYIWIGPGEDPFKRD